MCDDSYVTVYAEDVIGLLNKAIRNVVNEISSQEKRLEETKEEYIQYLLTKKRWLFFKKTREEVEQELLEDIDFHEMLMFTFQMNKDSLNEKLQKFIKMKDHIALSADNTYNLSYTDFSMIKNCI